MAAMPANIHQKGTDMKDATPLITAMAEQCRTRIRDSRSIRRDLPQALQPRHLLWMSDRIIENTADWSDARLHRWLGFIQCGMVANGMIDLDGAKAMFDAAKNAYAGSLPDDDLVDHMDSDNAFRIDIGGEG